MADIAKVAQELASETAPAEAPPATASVVGAEAPASAPADAAAPEAATTLIGVLDADERIRAGSERSERTLWASAAFVTLLYAAIIAAQVMNLGGLSALEQELERQRQERRGRNPTPSASSSSPTRTRTPRRRNGRTARSSRPIRRRRNRSRPLPYPSLRVEQPQPTEEPAEAEPQEETAETEREAGQPSLPSLEALVDAAADDLSRKVKEHYDRKPSRPQPQQQAMYSGGGMQVRGSGASGKSDEFNKAVIAALMKTRPGPFALWGRVLVTFQITQQGDLLYVRVLHSSGNKAMDDAAVNAIHRAKFIKPPEGLPAEARTYIIDYIFG
ncbi:MAG: energy transducer TonB [Hyphomicrobium sp.]|nr:energy transducer TonB [Hyphomicrobium sp.]